MEDQSRIYQQHAADDVREMLRDYQNKRRKEKRFVLIFTLFPALWSLKDRFFYRLFLVSLPFPTTKFDRDRARWLELASWQSLLKVTESRYKWFSFAFPISLASSYVLPAASRLGIHVAGSIILNILAYLFLYLLLWACPRAIRANLANLAVPSTWRPASKIDTIKGFLADTLRKEIVTRRLTAGDLPNLNHALEEEALAHEIARTGKPWLYVGLDQTAMNLVREVGMAAAKARGGIAYEHLIDRKVGKWKKSEDVAKRVYLRGERGPILYRALIDPLSVEVEIEAFKKDADLSIAFSRLGRNFYPDRRVEYLIDGYDLFVDERSADTVLNIVARNESCKKPWFRLAAWLLVFLILVLNIYQGWQALQRIIAVLT